MTTRQGWDRELKGLRASAVLLICMGCLFAIWFLLFLAVVVLPYLRHVSTPWHDTWRFLLLVVASGTLAFGCWRGARALRMGRPWAAYLAMALGVLCLAFCVSCIRDLGHPERQVGDSGEAILLVPFVLPIGLWWCVYLNLPLVRAEMRRLRAPDLDDVDRR